MIGEFISCVMRKASDFDGASRYPSSETVPESALRPGDSVAPVTLTPYQFEATSSNLGPSESTLRLEARQPCLRLNTGTLPKGVSASTLFRPLPSAKLILTSTLACHGRPHHLSCIEYCIGHTSLRSDGNIDTPNALSHQKWQSNGTAPLGPVRSSDQRGRTREGVGTNPSQIPVS